MFAVMTMVTEMKATNGNTIKIVAADNETGLIGIIPVYKTREQAEAVHPGFAIFEITERKR